MRKEHGQRDLIEDAIDLKIAEGDIQYLHLPARDMLALYKMTKGEEINDFAHEVDLAPRSFKNSLRYLQSAFDVASTEQTFSMLVARGFPLPDEVLPDYTAAEARFSLRRLDFMKGWVEGKSFVEIGRENGLSESTVKEALRKAREKVHANSNIQLIAVAVREGFLQSYQKDDGSYAFAIDDTPYERFITPAHLQVLKLKFAGMTHEEVSRELGISESTVRDRMDMARISVDAVTDTQLVLHCLENGQLVIDDLTKDVDLEKTKELGLVQRQMIENVLYGSYIFATYAQMGAVLHYSTETMSTYAQRAWKILGVKSFLQAVIAYKAAVDKGVIARLESGADTTQFPSSGTIFSRDEQ